MPRGIYDRSKMMRNNPEAKTDRAPAVKRVPAKKNVRRAKLSLKPVNSLGSVQNWDKATLSGGSVSLPVPETKPYFVIGDSNGLHIFGTVDEAVRHMVSNGADAEAIGGSVSTQILELHMQQEPTPKNVRLTYTL